MIKSLSSNTPQLLHAVSAACRWSSGGLPIMLIAGVMLGIVAPAAQATHFRFGHIHAGPGAQPNEVKFVVQTVWRLGPGASTCIDPATGSTTACSGPGGQAAIGDIVSSSPGGLGSFAFGDGNSAPPRYLVTSISPVPPGGDNWYFGVLVDTAEFPNVVPTVTHTYASPGPRTAQISGCCRISSSTAPNRHINNPDGNYSVRATIDVGTGNSTPVALIPPIVLCPIDDVCTIPIQAVDPEGDTLRFRFSTSGEAGGSFTQPGPPHAPNAATIDPDTGVFTWDTTGANLGGVDPIDWNVLYSTHVTIEDLDEDDNVKSSVALDFFIRLVPVVGPAPQFNEPDPLDPLVIHAMVGDTVNFNVSVKPGEEPEPECGDPGSGNCCDDLSGTPYCDDQDCCEQICAQDPFCCDVEWDSLCANAANDQCAICIVEASDTCEDAQLVTCGAKVIGSTVDATFSMAGTCETSHTAPEVWYRLIGTGDEIEVTTCNDEVGFDYDTKLTVWTGDCDELVCVGGNDDSPCPHGGLLSRVTFHSVAGQEYFIMVHGFGAHTGTFGLDVNCDIPASTGPPQRLITDGIRSIGGHSLDKKNVSTGGTHLPDIAGDISPRPPSVLFGNGPDPNELTLNVVGLPPGATMDPELPITDIGGITSNFTWIPQPQHVGTHIVIYTATSAFGQSVLLPVTIIVEELEVLCGDLNFDDVVDDEDLIIFMNAFGSCVGDPQYNPLADYNGDGCVGMADLAIWNECYQCFIDPDCPEPDCPGSSDIDGDGVVDGSDLLILLSEWGTCADPSNCPADLDCDGVVDGSDLLILLSEWG